MLALPDIIARDSPSSFKDIIAFRKRKPIKLAAPATKRSGLHAICNFCQYIDLARYPTRDRVACAK